LKSDFIIREFVHFLEESGMIADEEVGRIKMADKKWSSDGQENGKLIL
jgi:hypothetical protein